MNAYDQAHLLAKAIKETECYKEFLKAKQMIEKDAQCKKIVEDFRSRQMELEKAHIMGQEPPAEKVQTLQQMQGIIQGNQKVKGYMEAEYKFARMMADVQKIIGEALNL